MQLRGNRILDKWLGYLLIAVLLPVTRLLGITLRRNHQTEKPPKHILFIKLLGLGSLLVASDAILAMRQKFPNTKFILITDSNIANGMKPFDVFDELWPVNTASFVGTCRDAMRFLLRAWKLQELWVADLEVYSKLTTVYALLTLAVNRFGFFLSPVFFRKFLNTHNIAFDQTGYLEDNYYQMAKAIANETVVPISAVVREQETAKQYILINNTCSDLALTRKLPEQTLATICNWILEHTDHNLAFMGTAKDRSAIEAFMATLPSYKHKLLNIAGVFDFEGYYQFINDNAACLVTIDSGPLHIARKLGVPTISVWGPTNPAHHLKVKTGEESMHQFLYAAYPCSPCVHRTGTLACGGAAFCMKEIAATDVIKQIEHLLSQLNSPSGNEAYKTQRPCADQISR